MKKIYFVLLTFFLAGVLFWPLSSSTALGEESVAENPLWVVLIADSHLGFKKSNEAFQAFLKDVSTLPFKPRIVINNGDVTEIGDPQLFELYKKGIDPIFEESYSVIGNHDTRWSPEGKKAFARSIDPRYYSKDFRGIHWMFLDSTLEHQTQGHVDRKEIRWIQSDLKDVPRDTPILVFSHHPFQWRGMSVDDGTDVVSLFQGYNVPAFFNGHGHKLERIQFRGIPFIENDALYHGNYLLFKKSGDRVELFEKAIGQPVLQSWFEFALHPKPSTSRILSPKLNARVKNIFHVRYALGNALAPSLQVDHESPISLPKKAGTGEVSVKLGQAGWHLLRLYSSSESPPEDQTWVFSPDKIKAIPLGEIYAGLASDGKDVFLGTLDGNVFALGKTGEIRWKRSLDGNVLAAPCADHDKVFVGTKGGSLYALGSKSGNTLWKFKRDFPFAAPPYVFGKTLFVGNGDKNFYAIDTETGKEKWETALGNFTEMQAVADQGKVFVGAWDHTFYALDAEDGHVIWKKNIGKAIYYSPALARPLVADGVVHVIGKDHHAYAFDEKTGEEKWTLEIADGFASPLLLSNEILFPSESGHLVAVDRDKGEISWQKKLDTAFYSASPIAQGEAILLVGVDGRFFILDGKTHETRVALRVSRGFNFSTPVIVGGKIWIGSLDGYLYAIPLH